MIKMTDLPDGRTIAWSQEMVANARRFIRVQHMLAEKLKNNHEQKKAP